MFAEMFSKLIRGANSPAVYCLSSQSERCIHSLPASFIKKNSWNRAVSDAEKLVGYPTSLMSVRALMDDDFANIAVHMRKLIGSEHPVLHIATDFLCPDKARLDLWVIDDRNIGARAGFDRKASLFHYCERRFLKASLR